MATITNPNTQNPTAYVSDDTSADSFINDTTSNVSSTSLDHQNSLQITIHKMNGQNFLQWSQSVKMYLQGRGCLGNLTGSVPTPQADDPSYAKWESKNTLIMVWLINLVEVGIGKTYIFISTAREM